MVRRRSRRCNLHDGQPSIWMTAVIQDGDGHVLCMDHSRAGLGLGLKLFRRQQEERWCQLVTRIMSGEASALIRGSVLVGARIAARP